MSSLLKFLIIDYELFLCEYGLVNFTASRPNTVRTTLVETSNYYNCILQRNCSTLIFFLRVWLAFVLMLTIFHHPKAKTFCMASFLARKKRRLPSRKSLFFLCRVLSFFLTICSVRYHCGGWPEEVNTCLLNSYMVYL